MKLKNLVEINCRGRGPNGQEVPDVSIKVTIELSKPYNKKPNDILVEPKDCPFLTGGHRERCKASHPDQDKVGDGVSCPYSFDYPYVSENNTDWKIPDELVKIMKRMKAS